MVKNVLLTAVLALAGSASAGNFTQVMKAQPDLSTSLSILNYVNLTKTVAAASGNTFLAPTNEAWTAFFQTAYGQTLFFPNGTAMNKSNSGPVGQLLAYHSVSAVTVEAPTHGGAIIWNTTFTNSSFSGPQRLVGYRGATNNFTFYSADNLPSTLAIDNIAWSTSTVFSNVQGINKVLIPPYTLSRTATDLALTAFAGALTTLNSTLSSSKAPITVFAPQNAAFAYIDAALSGATTAQLSSILSYHVISGRYYVTPSAPFDSAYAASGTLANGNTYPTLDSNSTVTVETHGDVTFINNAMVVQGNIPIRNGIMHIVDQVLNPSNKTVAPSSATAGVAAYSSASAQTTMVPFTSAITTQTTTVAQVQTYAAAPAARTAAAGLAAVAAGAVALMV